MKDQSYIRGRRESRMQTDERKKNLESALLFARQRTEQTGHPHVVRDDGVRYFVVPNRREYELFGKLVD